MPVCLGSSAMELGVVKIYTDCYISRCCEFHWHYCLCVALQYILHSPLNTSLTVLVRYSVGKKLLYCDSTTCCFNDAFELQ